MRSPPSYKLPLIDQYLTLDLGSFHIIGRGIAGVESVYTIPEFHVTFDTGRAPSFAFAQDFLALTHFHLDHAGGLGFYLGLRALNDLKPLQLIVPPEKKQETEMYLENLKRISEHNFSCVVLEASRPIETKRGIFLEGIPSYHCSASVGYLVRERRKKLKLEFKGKSENEIIEAKRKGLVIDEEKSELVFAYSGDTQAEFLKSEASKAKVFLMECSFFSEKSDINNVHLYGHSHITDWLPYVDSIESETIILTHTSQRYQKKEIEEYCKKHLPKHILDRLVIFR